MNLQNENHVALIGAKALGRLAEIFHIAINKLHPDMRFGDELKASFVSDFRRNELDQVSDDIYDVADRAVAKELGSGRVVIRTVKDYCEHMIRCSKVKPKDVMDILGITEEIHRG